MRMDRRAGLLISKTADLIGLFASINVTQRYYSYAATTGNRTWPKTGITAYPYYILLLAGPTIKLYKFTSSTSFSLLKGEGSLDLKNTESSYAVDQCTSIGLLQFDFGNFPQADVDRLLDDLTISVLASRYQTSLGTVVWTTPNVVDDAIYIVSSPTGYSNQTTLWCSLSSGNDIFSPIYSNTDVVYMRFNTSNGRYQLCLAGPSGTSATTVYTGGIYQLAI